MRMELEQVEGLLDTLRSAAKQDDGTATGYAHVAIRDAFKAMQTELDTKTRALEEIRREDREPTNDSNCSTRPAKYGQIAHRALETGTKKSPRPKPGANVGPVVKP